MTTIARTPPNRYPRSSFAFFCTFVACCVAFFTGRSAVAGPLVYVSTEEGGEVIAIDPAKAAIAARIPVGKRPRGMKVSPDGKLLYVALSGSPRIPPGADESKLPPADRAADGVGVAVP